MLVRFPQTLVISEYFNYDQFGEIVLALPLDGEDRPFTGTAIDEPGAAANARTLANSLRRITLDDGLGARTRPTLRHPNGDPFSLDEPLPRRRHRRQRGRRPRLRLQRLPDPARPGRPTTRRSIRARPHPTPVGGSLRAAAMNTLNFFITPDYPTGDARDNKCGPANTLECRGADFDQPLEFTRQRDKLLQALAGLDADIIGLNEIENSTGVEPARRPDQRHRRGSQRHARRRAVRGHRHRRDRHRRDPRRADLPDRPRSSRSAPFQVLDSTVDPRFIDTRNRPVARPDLRGAGDRRRGSRSWSTTSSRRAPTAPTVGDPDTGRRPGQLQPDPDAAAQALVDWLATDPTGSGDRDVPDPRRPELVRPGGPDRRDHAGADDIRARPTTTPT